MDLRNKAINHGLTKTGNHYTIVITMLIHTRNEHPDLQTNKLNAKYYLHVQHSTNATTQGNCIKDIKSNKGHKSNVLRVVHSITTSTKATKHGYIA